MSAASDLTGKTALVTGASRGIGAAILHTLAAAGAQVIGTATSDAGVSAINQAGGSGRLYDARDAESFDALAGAAADAVDILVVNAAINADGLLMRMKDDAWQAVLDVNLTAAHRLSQALLRGMMKKRWGRVVFISSVVASVGNMGQANYCAAKAGIEGYCRAMAREVAARGITVNAVAPGFIETDMTAKLPESIKARFIENIPVGHIGAPADVAAAVGYLASDAAGYVTGQVLHVNGGLYMG